jgi:SAM-dependent methyltransferase
VKLYNELADWWPLVSAPEEYEEEAALYHRLLDEAMHPAPQTVLELGSGGGNNASYMKAFYKMTLADLSEGMLAVSRALNPDCEHVQGDMRTLRLGRTFDAVFVHDAVDYMTSEADLRAAMSTAYEHLHPGGVALFAPDFVRENFKEGADVGGRNDGQRGVRYLDWTFDPDPSDTTYIVDFALVLHERDGRVRVVHDRQTSGLFSRDEWLRLLRELGFEPSLLREEGDEGRDLFLGKRAS